MNRVPFDDLRAQFKERQRELASAFDTGSTSGSWGPEGPAAAPWPETFGVAIGKRHARSLDELLVRLFARVRDTDLAGVELAGVGSYGRGAVALKSDLDVRLLAKKASRAQVIAEELLYPLWDMGVTIGHQVVTIDDLLDAARDDLPSATSILEWRHVAGDIELSRELARRAAEGLFAHSELPRFFARLEAEVAARHARFGGSVYLLEPDVKNGAGGIRDLDVVRWAAKARYGVGEPEELVRVGLLVPREATETMAASELLWRIRNLLHAHAGRRSDRLSFDEQEAIATVLGYGRGGEAVERFMSDYYRAARAVSRLRDMVLARAMPVLSRKRPRDEDLGAGVRLFDGAVALADAEQLRVDPALALRAMSVAVERSVPLYAHARDAIVRATADATWCAALRESSEASARFRSLVASRQESPLRTGSVMRELHDTGLLLAMIPEFSPVVGRVHHDTYHVYTVDVHSVAAVDRLAALARGDLAGEYPLACRLAAEIVRPEMLFFATLLHDVGKAIGGTDHSQRGADMAAPILARLGFDPRDVDEACHLIRKHLLMYHVATRRDLDDPATIEDLTREVRGREGLRDLYLLTVADLSTTSPTSMTSWKARMLDELYLATDEALGGGAADDDRRARVELEIAARIDTDGGEEIDAKRAFLATFLASMPERYVLANPPEAIAAHAELARRHEGTVSIEIVPSRHPEAAEICVVAADRPGLLAAITAAIAASRLEVHAAQIHSRTSDRGVEAIDLFWVRDRGDGVQGVARSIPKLVRDVESILEGRVDGRELVQARVGRSIERKSPDVRTRVSIDDRASPRHTVIEVITRDRPGLLFAISDVLHRLGLGIAVAKINTEGTRAADVFYVSESDGAKIALGQRSHAVETSLCGALDALTPHHEGRQG
jgi:[protein-PII] uridylyltransferase